MENNKNLSKWIWVVGIAVILVLVISTSSNKLVNNTPIKIGFVGPLTGPLANPGEFIKNSFELANLNNSTLSNGKKITVVFEDDKGDVKESVTAATKLLNVDKVDIVVSAINGGSMLAISKLTEPEKKILISPVASAVAISEAGDYVFRISASANLFAEKSAEKVKELKFDNVAILAETTQYAIDWKDAFVKNFDGTITSVETFNSGDKDVKSQLLKIKATKPQAIILVAQNPVSASLIVKQASELNTGAQLIGNEAFFARGAVRGLMGKSAEGLLILTYKYSTDSIQMKALLSDYKVKFNKDLSEEMYGALGYDVYNVLYDALNVCKTADSDCLANYLYGIKNKDGASGKFSIDNKGDGIRDFMWWKVQNGALVPQDQV